MPFCEDCGAEIFNGEPCKKCNPVQASSDRASTVFVGSSVKSTAFLSQFQKNVLFVAVTVFILVAASITVNYVLHERERHLEEQKVQWKKSNIKILKDLSDIGALSTEEQTRLDNAGDDLDRIQQVLLDIHEERITVWSHRMEDLEKQYRNLQTDYYSQATYGNSMEPKLQQEIAEAKDNLTGYVSARAKIRQWKPIPFEVFRTGKMIDPGTSELAKPSEQ